MIQKVLHVDPNAEFRGWIDLCLTGFTVLSCRTIVTARTIYQPDMYLLVIASETVHITGDGAQFLAELSALKQEVLLITSDENTTPLRSLRRRKFTPAQLRDLVCGLATRVPNE